MPRRSSRPANRPRKPGSRGAASRSSTCSTTCTAAARPNRASSARGIGSWFSIVPVASPSVSRPDEAFDSVSVSVSSPSSCASSNTPTSIVFDRSPAAKTSWVPRRSGAADSSTRDRGPAPLRGAAPERTRVRSRPTSTPSTAARPLIGRRSETNPKGDQPDGLQTGQQVRSPLSGDPRHGCAHRYYRHRPRSERAAFLPSSPDESAPAVGGVLRCRGRRRPGGMGHLDADREPPVFLALFVCCAPCSIGRPCPGAPTRIDIAPDTTRRRGKRCRQRAGGSRSRDPRRSVPGNLGRSRDHIGARSDSP